jgi:ribosomal protein L37AE/L43A
MSLTASLIIVALACVGLVISSLLPAGTPEGRRRVKCPRCGKKQNAIARNPLWECCQCRLVSLTPRTAIERDKRIREEIRWGLLDD